VYHATKESKMISSAREEAKLGPEWSRTYIHKDYPKAKYHRNGKTVTVKDADEEAALEGGWADTPAASDPSKGARPEESVHERSERRRAVVMPILTAKTWTPNKWVTKAGVSKNSVYEYLGGKRNLSLENRQALAEELGLKPEELPH